MRHSLLRHLLSRPRLLTSSTPSRFIISSLQSSSSSSSSTPTRSSPALLRTTLRNMTTAAAPPAGPVLHQTLKMALVQLASGKDKAANLAHAAEKVRKAASSGAKLVVLPECFNSPYGTNYFPEYAEVLLPSDPSSASSKPEDAPSYDALSRMASDNHVFLVGGSIPEYNPTTKKHYNTSLTFGPDGVLLATHRKVHLFDIDIPGKISFHESDVLSPGNQITLVPIEGYGTIAVAICYDVRFPELATVAARKGAFALVYPGAFNLTTGPLHWRLLAQARALDNQIYVAMCSPARDMEASYHAYGHTLLVDPMAQIVEETEETETIVEVALEPERIEETRRNIQLNNQRRWDVYPDVSKGKVQLEDPELPTPKHTA